MLIECLLYSRHFTFINSFILVTNLQGPIIVYINSEGNRGVEKSMELVQRTFWQTKDVHKFFKALLMRGVSSP